MTGISKWPAMIADSLRALRAVDIWERGGCSILSLATMDDKAFRALPFVRFDDHSKGLKLLGSVKRSVKLRSYVLRDVYTPRSVSNVISRRALL